MLIEGVRNRSTKNINTHNKQPSYNKQHCKNKCPDNDIECLQRYAECGNCKFSVTALNNTKQKNTLNLYKDK